MNQPFVLLACFEMKTAYTGHQISKLTDKVGNAKECMLRCQFTSRYLRCEQIELSKMDPLGWVNFYFVVIFWSTDSEGRIDATWLE